MINLLKRIIVAVIFIPLILFVFYKGGYFLFGFLSIIGFVGLVEFREISLKKGIEVDFFLPLLGFLFFGATVKFGIFGFSALFPIIFILMIKLLFTNQLDGAITRTAVGLFGIVYITGALALAYLVSLTPNGKYELPLLIILIWFTDSFAYFAGMTLGRKRNIFKASPKKSIIGFVAGIISPIIIVTLIHLFKPEIIGFYNLIGLAIAAGIFGQIGDLFESVIKRDFGVKDSSNILPGHGGILDRFDSFFIAISAYWFISILIGYFTAEMLTI